MGRWIKQVLVALVVVIVIAMQPVFGAKPNVIIILSDDQGWGDLSLNGNTNLETPNIDSIAREGVEFDRFYVCAVCSPTRAEFLTGRYHARCGVYSTSAGGERLNLDEVTIADTFRAAGYRTGAFGKWHNGMQYPYHPNGRGFDEFYGFCSGHWGNYFSPPLEHNGQIVRGDGFCIDDFTNHAIDFMSASLDEGKPFLAYLPYNTPHSPMQVPDAYWSRFQDKDLQLRNRDPEKEDLPHTRCALAMCENIDWNVGRILKKLEEWEIGDNTIVMYFSDNGPNGVRWNGGMKGRKGSVDEGGVRSPLLVRWPGKISAGRTIRPIASATDLLPTLSELCKVELQSKKPLDGRSLAPLLLGQNDDAQDRMLVHQWKNKLSVRNQRFRLSDRGDLFDIEQDPEQRRDVSAEHRDVKQRLQAFANDYAKSVQGYDQDERPFLIGHRNYRYTQVPARDASATGNITRSNRYPNCSFFTNWKSTDDFLYWDCQVAASGKYQVELYYTCAPENVGCELELKFRDSVLPFRITEAHNPPLEGAENDRVKRQESYVKDFKSLDIGTIELDKGVGRLELRTTHIAGDQSIDFRLLMFTKVD